MLDQGVLEAQGEVGLFFILIIITNTTILKPPSSPSTSSCSSILTTQAVDAGSTGAEAEVVLTEEKAVEEVIITFVNVIIINKCVIVTINVIKEVVI